MTKDLKDALTQSRATLLGDAVGALSIVVLLWLGLTVPALI